MDKAAQAIHSDAVIKRLTKSPGRVTQILELVARAGAQGMTLTEISKATESPRTSVIGLLDSLVHEDYIIRHEKSYRLGWSAFRLAAAVTSSFQLPALARAELERVSRETGETTLLCIPSNENREIVYVDKCESTEALRFTIEIGTKRPLYSSAGGRAILAFLPEAWQKEYLHSTTLNSLTPKTVTDVRRLREILKEVRELGYSSTIEETAIGVTGAASPILDQFRRPLGALVIAAPLARGAGMAEKYGAIVHQSALQMSLS